METKQLSHEDIFNIIAVKDEKGIATFKGIQKIGDNIKNKNILDGEIKHGDYGYSVNNKGEKVSRLFLEFTNGFIEAKCICSLSCYREFYKGVFVGGFGNDVNLPLNRKHYYLIGNIGEL